VTHPVAEDAGPITLTALTAPDGAVIVALEGDLDIASAPAARERLLSLLRPGACRLVIDMSARSCSAVSCVWRRCGPR
jgi:hypothetical protein